MTFTVPRGVMGVTICLLLQFSLWADEPSSQDACDLRAPIRVLVITGGHGFEQAPFFSLFDANPDVKVTHATYPSVADQLRPELADAYDVIVFYDMWAQGISPVQQRSFQQLLERGVGVVALHHTLASHQDWPEYARILGGKYHLQEWILDGKKRPKSTFLHGQDVNVHVVDRNHPITRGMADFPIHEETYKGYTVDPDVTVLLTTEHPASGPKLAWAHTYGNSRLFYIEMGHDHHAYENKSYRQLVARGIRWVAGRPTDPDGPPIELFNGRDLSGWKRVGKADWQVKDGRLIGRQGPGNAPGDLLSEETFADFQLDVTFQVVWPANSGVWYRYQSAKQAYQADILEYRDPHALTGSLYCTGKMFLATNTDPKLVDRDGWNRLVIRAVGNRQTICLNGHKVADVRDDTSSHGRIGFQVHPGDAFAGMQIRIRRVALRPL
ncbi:MAG: ThuA domain-containing protein [Pirellulales bacterium]